MDRTDADRIKEAFERLARAVQDSYEAAAEGAVSIREANLRLTRSVLQSNTELLRAQAEIQADFNRRTREHGGAGPEAPGVTAKALPRLAGRLRRLRRLPLLVLRGAVERDRRARELAEAPDFSAIKVEGRSDPS